MHFALCFAIILFVMNEIFISFTKHYELFVRLAFAFAAGALVGIEREFHGRPAGIRTHILVSLGSALIALISLELSQATGMLSSDIALRVDPGRIAAGVVTGIGFLGAGVIIKIGISARGLTTAASLWCIASVGMGFGFGLYALSIIGTLFMLLTLMVLSRAEKGIQRNWYKSILVEISDSLEIGQLRDTFKSHGWRILDLKIKSNKRDSLMYVEYDVRLNSKQELASLIKILENAEFVTYYRIK